MTIEVNGNLYYTTLEVCQQSGVSRSTLYRWLKKGILEHYQKHRRGWRIFTQEDLNRIKAEAERINIVNAYPGRKYASV